MEPEGSQGTIYISSDDEQESVPVKVATYIRENVVSAEYAAKDIQFWRDNLVTLRKVLDEQIFRGQQWGLCPNAGGLTWKADVLTEKNMQILLNARVVSAHKYQGNRKECLDAIVEAFKMES